MEKNRNARCGRVLEYETYFEFKYSFLNAFLKISYSFWFKSQKKIYLRYENDMVKTVNVEIKKVLRIKLFLQICQSVKNYSPPRSTRRVLLISNFFFEEMRMDFCFPIPLISTSGRN